MIGIVETATVTIEVLGIDIAALKKLSLVSHALADKIGRSAGEEQRMLATVLDSTIRKIELAAARPAQPEAEVRSLVTAWLDANRIEPGVDVTQNAIDALVRELLKRKPRP